VIPQLFAICSAVSPIRKPWEEGKLSAEVMTAYASPFREPLEQDNNIRKNSTLADSQRRQTQLFGPRLGHQDHRRRAIRQRRAVGGGNGSPFREPLEQDNNIRKNSTLADYQKLRPAFDRKQDHRRRAIRQRRAVGGGNGAMFTVEGRT
jgi:hypothetical protein